MGAAQHAHVHSLWPMAELLAAVADEILDWRPIVKVCVALAHSGAAWAAVAVIAGWYSPRGGAARLTGVMGWAAARPEWTGVMARLVVPVVRGSRLGRDAASR
ncbi:hypothetical protein GCM10009638_02100 [Luteococcus sanguinis]